MRSFLPSNIATLTVQEILDATRERGGLFSLELAGELKANKLLHWLVMHRDDIALSNFLVGDKKAVFENIEALDIIELRALASWIPKKFELDNDGRKLEWRQRLMQRVRLLVSQEKGEQVKGCWDARNSKRAMVTLPTLKPEQCRRSIYYYQTMKQSLLRIKQCEDKECLLAKKKALLKDAENLSLSTKRDYDEVLAESRDPDIKNGFSPSKVNLN